MNKTVYVYDEEDVCLPDNAIKFMEFFQEKLSLIPDEYIDIARIDLNGYTIDCSSMDVEVYYYRPETDSESEERIAKKNNEELEVIPGTMEALDKLTIRGES